MPSGAFFSAAAGVSSDGAVVAGISESASGFEAFRWTQAGGMVDLGDLPGGMVRSRAFGISGDGAVVVGSSFSGSGDGDDEEAMRWTAAGGMVGLGDLPGGAFLSDALDVSADGSVVVGDSSSASGLEAFRWTAAGGMVGLGDLPGGEFFSRANAVSDDGAVVVGDSRTLGPGLPECVPCPGGAVEGHKAFRWTAAGGMVDLGDLPGGANFSDALGVSADGSVIVGDSSSASGVEAFRWTAAGGMVGLGDLPGGAFVSQAFDASGDGSVVVGLATSASGVEAFIWDAVNGMRSLKNVLTGFGLDLTGWTLEQARGVSADGRTVVGFGTNPSGQPEAWLARVEQPAAELCDGVDNDLDGQVDEGFPNTDGDAQADCVDGDDDNDGIVDGVDPTPLAFSNNFRRAPADANPTFGFIADRGGLSWDVFPEDRQSAGEPQIARGVTIRASGGGDFDQGVVLPCGSDRFRLSLARGSAVHLTCDYVSPGRIRVESLAGVSGFAELRRFCFRGRCFRWAIRWGLLRGGELAYLRSMTAGPGNTTNLPVEIALRLDSGDEQAVATSQLTPGQGVDFDVVPEGQPNEGSLVLINLGPGSLTVDVRGQPVVVEVGGQLLLAPVTFDSLCALVRQLSTDDGVAKSLCAKLAAAQDAAARGQTRTKTNILNAFANEVGAQTGKVFTADQAALVKDLASLL